MALRGTQLKLRGSQTIWCDRFVESKSEMEWSVLICHLSQKAGVW